MTEVIDGEAVEVGTDLELRSPQALNLFNTQEPGEVIERAAAVAGPLADVIRKQKLYKTIQGKNHVFVEGWTLLGSMLGVVPVVVWTRKLDNGWEARVEARTLDGRIVGAAESQCLRAESRWKSADDYAIRSMAQTRATSRAMRGPLGFVIQLAGFQPEPAEDMPEPQSAGEPSGRGRRAAPVAAEAGSEERTAASPAEDSGAGEPAGEKTRTASATEEAHPTPAPETSPFKAPTGPRGGKSTQLEADELAARLVELIHALGATDSLAKVEEKRATADIPWLKRQITTAEKALERRKEEQA